MKKYAKFLLTLITVLCLFMMLGSCAAVGEDAASIITLEVISTAMDIVATAAIALIGVAGAWLTAKIGQNKKLTNISEAIKQVVAATQLTVGELQQTAVEAMKAADANGKLTEAQIADLKRQLLQKTAAKLTAPTVQLLEAAKMDVNALIQGVAEDLIGQMHTS